MEGDGEAGPRGCYMTGTIPLAKQTWAEALYRGGPDQPGGQPPAPYFLKARRAPASIGMTLQVAELGPLGTKGRTCARFRDRDPLHISPDESLLEVGPRSGARPGNRWSP